MADFIANFVPWKGTNSTENLNTEYTNICNLGFKPGDIVTAPSTNAALRMTTLICSAVANLYQLDESNIDSSLGSVLSKMKANATAVFGTTFNSEMIFNGGAAFNTVPLTINKSTQIILHEQPLPNVDSSGNVNYEYYLYGLGNAYTITQESERYARGLESKFYMADATDTKQNYYKIAFHSFLDMKTTGSTASETTSTIFDIQKVKSGLHKAVFYVRPNGNLTSTKISVTDGEENETTRPEVQIFPNKIDYLDRVNGATRSITWKSLFDKLDKIQ